jgi:polysaccharide pyruvyl transferase WcaK-like protein
MLYANGIGPVNGAKNREKVRDILNQVNLITLRDEDSLEEIKKMGVINEAIVTADPALTIDGIDSQCARKILMDTGIDKDRKILGISIRNWKGCDGEFWDNLAKGLDEICEKYELTPLWIPLKHPEDIEISKTAAGKMETKSYVLERNCLAEEIVGIVGECEAVVAMRLHSMIYASAKCVPAIGISYDPKVSGFAKYIGTPNVIDVEKFNSQEFIQQAEDVFAHKEEIQNNLSQKVAEFKEKAVQTAEMAIKLIER